MYIQQFLLVIPFVHFFNYNIMLLRVPHSAVSKKYLGHTCFILNKTFNTSNFFPCCPFYFFIKKVMVLKVKEMYNVIGEKIPITLCVQPILRLRSHGTGGIFYWL